MSRHGGFRKSGDVDISSSMRIGDSVILPVAMPITLEGPLSERARIILI